MVGPLVFKPQDAPRYVPGFIVVVVTSVAAAVLALVYRLICIHENKKRDREGPAEGFEHAYDDDITDRKVCARLNQVEPTWKLTLFRIHNSDTSSEALDRC